MPSPLETIRTDVDLLIELVKNKKEISFDEAAKELKLPASTVESWASFLEEDGVVAIKYKFTTPYLHYVAAAGKASEMELKVATTFEDKIKEIENLLESAFNHIKNGNYEMAESIYPALNQEIRTVHQLMREKDTLNKLPIGEGIIEKLKEVEQTLESAKELTEKGDYERAREIYLQMHNNVREIILLVREMNMELIRIYGEKQALEAREKKDEVEFDLKKIRDVDELLKKAYEFLKSGEIEKAKRVYDKIQENYDFLAEEYRGKKDELNRNLLKLNKDLSLHIGKVSMKDIEERDREINRLMKDVRSNLEKNNISGAEKLFSDIEGIFKDFPSSYLERKLDIEKKLLELRQELIQKKKSFFYSELKQKGSEITRLLGEIRTAILKKDVRAAMEGYGKVKVLYSELPAGFLTEKIELQDKVFEVYKRLIEINKEVSQEDFLAKREKIVGYIPKVDQLLRVNELGPVEDLLNKAYGIFNQLPMGFLSEKTNIQDRLLKLSRRYTDQREKSTVGQFNANSERIKKLFKTIEDYISNKEFDLAREVYSEITNVFNQLPAGFMKEKTELKTKILGSYKKLMLSSDETFLKDVNQATKDKYENLLRLLIQIHSHIDLREFDTIEPNYQHIINLYNELPLGFLKKKINIREEINKVYDELRLYNLTKQIDAAIKSKDYSQIIPMMNSLHELYHKLIAKSAQDIELFKLVNQRYGSYLKVLKIYEEDEALVRRGIKMEIKPPVVIEQASEEPPAPELPGIKEVEAIAERLKRAGERWVEEKKLKEKMPEEPKPEEKKIKIKEVAVEPKEIAKPEQWPSYFGVHQFRALYYEALNRLSKGDFSGAKERVAEIDKNRGWSASVKPLSELLEHLASAPAKLPEQIANLVSLGIMKAEHSYEGKLMLTKIVRGLNSYFAGDSRASLKDLERVRAAFRNASEVKEVIDLIAASLIASAKIEPESIKPAEEKPELPSQELEPPLLRPSVEKLLILRKLRRANEQFLRGDYGSASSDFQRVLEIDPLNRQAAAMVEKIRQHVEEKKITN